MILYLYNDTTDVADKAPYGAICSLPDLTECVLTEELNGTYECEFSYPIDGENADQIKLGMLVYEPGGTHFFKIYSFSKPLEGVVTYKALLRQQWYTNKTVLCPIASASRTLEDAYGAIWNRLKTDYTMNGSLWFPYTLQINNALRSENYTAKRTYGTTVPMKLADALIGSDESLIHYYGVGEWLYSDPKAITLVQKRGSSWALPILQEGNNLTNLVQEADMTNFAWGVVPYWKGTENTSSTDSQETVVTAPAVANNMSVITGEWDALIKLLTGKVATYEMPLLIPLDCSEKFSKKPTQDQLTTYAKKYIESSKLNNVYTSISADALQRTYNFYGDSQSISFHVGDTIDIKIDDTVVSLRVRKRSYDLLQERIKDVEFGSKKTRLTDLFEKRKQTS